MDECGLGRKGRVGKRNSSHSMTASVSYTGVYYGINLGHFRDIDEYWRCDWEAREYALPNQHSSIA